MIGLLTFFNASKIAKDVCVNAAGLMTILSALSMASEPLVISYS